MQAVISHCHSGAGVFVQGFELVADVASCSDSAKPSSCMMEHYTDQDGEIKVNNNISWGRKQLNPTSLVTAYGKGYWSSWDGETLRQSLPSCFRSYQLKAILSRCKFNAAFQLILKSAMHYKNIHLLSFIYFLFVITIEY